MNGSQSSVLLSIIGAVLLIGCGAKPSDSPEVSAVAITPPQAEAEESRNSSVEESTEGLIVFTVNDTERSFGFLPGSAATFNPLASTMRAHPVAGSAESLTINFMSIDLKNLDYPTDLPPTRDPSKPAPSCRTGTVHSRCRGRRDHCKDRRAHRSHHRRKMG